MRQSAALRAVSSSESVAVRAVAYCPMATSESMAAQAGSGAFSGMGEAGLKVAQPAAIAP